MKKRAKKKVAKKKAGKKKKAARKVAKRRPRKVARKAARGAKKRPIKSKKPKKPKKSKKHKPPRKPKKHGPKGHKTKKPVKHEVVLVEPNGPDHVPVMSVSRGDMVRWFNETTSDRTLTFTVWIFRGTETSIFVPAGGVSDWYTILATAVQPHDYSYGILPPFLGTGGPTDPPQVSADG